MKTISNDTFSYSTCLELEPIIEHSTIGFRNWFIKTLVIQPGDLVLENHSRANVVVFKTASPVLSSVEIIITNDNMSLMLFVKAKHGRM